MQFPAFFFIFIGVLRLSSSIELQECADKLEIDEFSPEKAADLHRAMEGAMRSGFWECAEEIGRAGAKSGVELRSILDMEGRIVQKHIQDLKAVIESSLPTQIINPAYQWAQSASEIFLNVKFSHKLDAPATLNVEMKNVSVTAEKLYLEAVTSRKTFILDLELWGLVDSSDAAWSMASVGRMTVTLKKEGGDKKWPRLLAASKKVGDLDHD